MGTKEYPRPIASSRVLVGRGILSLRSNFRVTHVLICVATLTLWLLSGAFNPPLPRTVTQYGFNVTGSGLETGQPKGVFVIKVSSLQGLEKTLCTLTQFFNGHAKYPIRIFVDHEPESEDNIRQFTADADVKIIVNKRWKELPRNLTKAQREKVISKCRNFEDPEHARCTAVKVSLGYVFNTYWTYMEMADEPELQPFDYFVLFDDDAFLTKTIPDPFKILQDNNLVGIFNIESMEGGLTAGVQEAAEASFSVEERKNAYLDSEQFQVFDENGIWGGTDGKKPGVWMCFFGGRLDFLRSKRFKEFASHIPFYTYTGRTSRQSVIPVGWSVLAGGDKVWYLPKRGIEMGVYHHGWVDNSEIIRTDDGSPFEKNTLVRWKNYTESKVTSLLTWKEYMEARPDTDVAWQQCVDAKGRKYGS